MSRSPFVENSRNLNNFKSLRRNNNRYSPLLSLKVENDQKANNCCKLLEFNKIRRNRMGVNGCEFLEVPLFTLFPRFLRCHRLNAINKVYSGTGCSCPLFAQRCCSACCEPNKNTFSNKSLIGATVSPHSFFHFFSLWQVRRLFLPSPFLV